jgi:hypothetical protein
LFLSFKNKQFERVVLICNKIHFKSYPKHCCKNIHDFCSSNALS